MKRNGLSFLLSLMLALSCVHSSLFVVSAEEEDQGTETAEETAGEEEKITGDTETEAAETVMEEEEIPAESDTETEAVEITEEEEEAVYSSDPYAGIDYYGSYDIFAGSDPEFPVTFVLPSDEYMPVIKVGGYIGEMTDGQFVYEFTEGEDYSFEDGIITLYTGKMIEKWQGDIAVYAAVMKDGSLEYSDTRFLYLAEPEEDYYRYDGEVLLPGWGRPIENWGIVFVRNGEYPDGEELDYDIIGARIVSETPEVPGRKVLRMEEITPEIDPYHQGWNYQAVSPGEADIEITYRKLSGEEDSYQFHVTVSTDAYDVNIMTENGFYIFFPGARTSLYADVYHSSLDPEREGNLDGITYEWKIDESSEEYMTLTQDPDNPAYADVVFKDDGNITGMVVCPVEVFIYDESGAKAAEAHIYLNIAEEFSDLYPAQIGQIMPGQSSAVTTELRHFTKGSDSYVLEDNVHFTWGYDPNALEVRDSSGNYVGPGEDEYVDSDESYGDSCGFTVTRKNGWGTNLRLEAQVEYPDGHTERFSRDYWFHEIDYNVWFDIPDRRLYSDGILEAYLEMNMPDGADCEIIAEAGISRDGVWQMQLQEGEDFNFDGEKITLYGDKIFAKGLQYVDLKATVLIDGETVSETYEFVEVNEAFADYELEEDRDMLIGWTEGISRFRHGRMENAEYPDGMDFEYEIKDVEIISEDCWEEGRSVLNLRKITDEENPEDFWWDYRATGHGNAEVKVTYTDLDGNEQSYTFRVNVGRDVYDVYVHSEDKSDRTLAGKTIKMTAELRRESEDGNSSLDSAYCEWTIREGSEWAVVQPDPNDSSKADVIIREAEPGERDYWDRVVIEAVVYDGTDDQGNPIERCRGEFHTHVIDSYSEIWPVEIRRDMNPGTEETVVTEVRLFESGEEGYTLADNVTYKWYYDEEDIEIFDSEGNKVGNENEDGEYNGSAASIGDQCEFTVIRKGKYDIGFHLEAEWTDEWGNDRHEGRDYWLENMDSRLWFEYEGDHIYTDGDKEVLIRTERISGEEGEDYTRVIKIGAYDEALQQEVIFAEGRDYTVEDDRIILHGEEIAKYDYDHFTVIAEIYAGGELLAFDMMEIRVDEPRYDYDREYDRSMLRNWTMPVWKEYRIYIENAEYPEGTDTQYQVTGVRIIRQSPETPGRKVAELFDEEDPGIFKSVRALDYGEAEIEVSYKDIDGKTKKYTFRINVSHDVYGVNIRTSNGSEITLPGGSIDLYAEGWHESDIDSSMDNVFYEWDVEWSDEDVTLTVDPEDSSHATAVFRDLREGEEYIWNDNLISVRLFDTDESGRPQEKAYGDIRLVMSDHYTEVWPAEMDEILLPGSSRAVTAVVREYSSEEEQYSLISNVHYRWYYVPGMVKITDAEGRQVGNNDGEGNYIDSSASYGTQVRFTITKTRNEHTWITLVADWTDEWGSYREERRDYELDDVWYDMSFHPEEGDVYDDYEAGAVLDSGVPGELEGCEIVVEAGVFEDDVWKIRLTEGTDFELDGSDLLVNGRTIHNKLPAGRDFFHVRASALYNGFVIGEAWMHFNVRHACGSHAWNEEIFIEPTETEEGLMLQTCANCGETRLIPIPPVQKIDPASISFADQSMEIPTDQTVQMVLNVRPEGADSSASWTSSNEKAAVVDEDGRVTALTYGKTTITAVSDVKPNLKASITIQTRFFDVNDSSQSYYKPVYWGADNGVVAGFNGGEYFGPDEDCTRAQFVTFLWRLAGKPTGTKDVSFPDVDPKANYFRAVKWAVSEGIIVGFKHDNAPATFEPDGVVTRGQVATMLWRYGGRKTPKTGAAFSDVKSSDSIFRAVSWGQEVGIIKGYKTGEFAGQFRPNDSCLRQHIVTFLYRYARDVMKKNVN